MLLVLRNLPNGKKWNKVNVDVHIRKLAIPGFMFGVFLIRQPAKKTYKIRFSIFSESYFHHREYPDSRRAIQ